MTESKGPDKQAGKPGPKKKRRGPVERLRPYAIGIMAMVVVFGGSALIGAHVRSTKDDKISAPSGAVGAAWIPPGTAPTSSASPSPSPTPTPTGPNFAVPVRPAVPVTITIYEDLRSPDSKAFAIEYQDMLAQLLTTGQAQLHYRMVISTDKQYGGHGAQIAANAAACAQDQGRFDQFVEQVFNNQPDPHTDSLANETLIKKLGRKTGKLNLGKFDPCVEQKDHEGWVLAAQRDFLASGVGTSAPVVQINGVTVHGVLDPQRLHTLVMREAARVVKLQATPAPTPALS
jgi:hypothetical protein